ncbi:PfkB family carbohydrate kinase [Actinomadura madurae]|uniref:PfkB family carbohydrate kinase n=1 Tax=Actinomadura madurae TaxID=1993 RepID=UPI0020D2236B|nr:hypothetical protein [Actinomadura madurae]MCP9976707.1 hypothetical protein [Actinomadura madurae]
MTAPLVVVGDVLLDIDIVGSSSRLCPDAPVPVVEQAEERPRPGGAGLAALLAAAEGREVVLVTALADDEPGRRLRAMLENHLEVAAFHLHGGTPCKLRIRSGGQSVARLDAGEGQALDGPVGPRVTDAIAGAGAVLVADYGRGVARHRAVRSLLEELPGGVPIVWDPHPRGEPPVPGTRLLTPNEQEAARLAAADGADITGSGLSAAGRRGRYLGRSRRIEGVAVTLGPAGALLCDGSEAPFLAPARPGAGRHLRGRATASRPGPPGRSPTARAWPPPSPRASARPRSSSGPVPPRPSRRSSPSPAPPGSCPSGARTRGTSSSGRGGRAARSWPPAAASTCCTRATSACCSRQGGSATA